MFDNLDDPRKQAMLAMAFGLLGGQGGKGAGGFARDLGQAGLLGLNRFAVANEDKRRSGLVEDQRKMQQFQFDQAKRGAEDQDFARQLAPQFFQPQNAPADGMGPVAPPKQDFMGYGQALAARNPQMGAQFMAMAPKPKEPQYKEVGGRLVRIDGEGVKEAYAPPEKPVFQPGQTRELKSGRRIITQEYDGKAWKTISTSDMDKPDGPDKGPSAPAGYRWNAAGGLEPIPGGPADTKAGEKAEALKNRQAGALQRADFVLSQVKEAINESGPLTAGPAGAIGRNIPGTGAYNLNKKLDSIRSNIGFAELQAMREASPTGGALGQVAVQELNMLQSVLGSLDTAQSPAQLEKNLYAIEKHYNNWKRAVQQSGSASNVDALVEKYGN